RPAPTGVREEDTPVREEILQSIWYDQLLPPEGLCTTAGQRIRVVSPGWWNRQDGPDFRGAQIEFNDRLYSGDVEVHLYSGDWKSHGHHRDSRYDQVILHVVLSVGPDTPAITSTGRRVAALEIGPLLRPDLRAIAAMIADEERDTAKADNLGQCADLVLRFGVPVMMNLLRLAGEWRMLNKARAMRERMEHAGMDQAVYEAFMYACGFSHFKHHFRAIARHLPYDRARQLAQRDPMILETALLQIGGLLPESLPEDAAAAPHYARLCAIRRDTLDGLRGLPLEWRRVGVRPNNNPERRLSGSALFIARTARDGLVESLEKVWRGDATPLQRRRTFEALFPKALGFWSAHCTWTGKRVERATAPIGAGRMRSIIGNVFVPAALALARMRRDQSREEKILTFFRALPPEPENHLTQRMMPRLFRDDTAVKSSFQLQQGLLQIHQDWCASNPSCTNCPIAHYLEPALDIIAGSGASSKSDTSA
ncbi:MAG TPA: DUF2851 family protein, partial [Candidatus Hydrogenedentes bacterium]|nr:DUF2851 family protein [Candidatus Hydrogenedentota bacterium]